MDFFEKFGDKILYYQSHRSGFDPELTVEELAKAIEDRIKNQPQPLVQVPPGSCPCGWRSAPGSVIRCDDIKLGPWYCPDCRGVMGSLFGRRKKSLACEHRDSRGWPYSGMNSYAAEPKSSLKGIYEPISYRYCPLCGDKLEG